jgi:hypothetical protein
MSQTVRQTIGQLKQLLLASACNAYMAVVKFQRNKPKLERIEVVIASSLEELEQQAKTTNQADREFLQELWAQMLQDRESFAEIVVLQKRLEEANVTLKIGLVIRPKMPSTQKLTRDDIAMLKELHISRW